MTKHENDTPKPSKWSHESFLGKDIKVTPPITETESAQDAPDEIALDKEITSFLKNLSIG